MVTALLASLPQVLALTAALYAALHPVLARKLDLGPSVLSMTLLVVVLGADPSLLLAVPVLVSLGWLMGAKRGVGRPDLLVLPMLLAAGWVALGLRAEPWLGSVQPYFASVCFVSGAACAYLALERPGLRRPPYRWIGRIPVEEG